MAVGVIADQIAMVEPDDVLRLEEILQKLFQLLTIERLVAMRRQKALGLPLYRYFEVVKMVPLPSLSILPPSSTNP